MKNIFIVLIVALLLSACGGPAQVPLTPTAQATVAKSKATLRPSSTPTVTRTPTKTPIPATETPSATPTPAYPPEGRGPSNFDAGVNPLTGFEVDDPALLARRPMVIKVENLPREHRPQWGLSLADLVYEYYTEQGSTRFAAVYYGQDSNLVAPIRSGRFFDSHIVQMYKAVFIYGSAWIDVRNSFFNSDFANRLILETNNSCPSVCRYDPNGQNLLMADTAALQEYLKVRGVDNSIQNLDGMFFQLTPPDGVPAGGGTAEQVYVRYSGAIYNRWDYDPVSGRYLRFSETQNDIKGDNPAYAQLTDRVNDQPIAADSVVMLCVPHQDYVRKADTEVIKILLDPKAAAYKAGCDGQDYAGGTGPAYVARDGKLYKTTWKRASADSILTLVNPDGSLFPFKPGQTWFEVLGSNSTIEQKDSAWRFVHIMR